MALSNMDVLAAQLKKTSNHLYKLFESDALFSKIGMSAEEKEFELFKQLVGKARENDLRTSVSEKRAVHKRVKRTKTSRSGSKRKNI